ncbi:MAG TPA: BMP family ABC transporter substrate-binding protein [Anaerolineales bacterium]|nr:BMP family ABC transporter substrate-binding protein [Anaerolineales bacterium]
MKQNRPFMLASVLLAAGLLLGACAPAATPTSAPPAAPTSAPAAQPTAAVEQPTAEPPKIVLAIEHFSPIAGTTWSGAHDRAGKRLAEKYPNLTYVYRESVAPDQTNPFAEELIASGANIVIGNAEFMGLPLKDIADKYPNVYFGSVIASDLSTKPNFIRFFPKQYQALYLEGLIAGALTQTGCIGITSAFPNVQVLRRTAGFVLGVQDAAEMLNKDVQVYVKYAGDWYLPADERAIAETLVDTYHCDVLTQQTDSSSTLDVAKEKGVWFVGKDMDIVGEYGWSDTNTVAVSFDTRWEVIYDKMIQEYMAGNKTPDTVLYPGMETTMTLADGTVEPTVDLMNDGKVGVDAISPAALPLIPQQIVDLVRQRREQMMKGEWDPFTEHEFVSNGTGLDLPNLPIPAAGTVVKAAGVVPTVEFLLSQFNFDVQGTTILE